MNQRENQEVTAENILDHICYLMGDESCPFTSGDKGRAEQATNLILSTIANRIMPEGAWPRDARGILIVSGEEVYTNGTPNGDGKRWTVLGFDFTKPHCIKAVSDDQKVRDLKPEWLTHISGEPLSVEAQIIEDFGGPELFLKRSSQLATYVKMNDLQGEFISQVYAATGVNSGLLPFEDACRLALESIDRMNKYQMPDGAEWPRYEDGEIVRLGDSAIDDDIPEWQEIDSINFTRDGEGGYSIQLENSRGVVLEYPANQPIKRLTAAVLDSNDAPIAKGDTVWHEDGTELKVIGFGHKEDGETLVKVERISGPTNWSECRNLSLTHKCPDPWKSLEDRANEIDFAMAAEYGDDFFDEITARDLVREAKKLAGCDAE